MVQDGLQLFISLSAGLEHVGQAQSGEEALVKCEELMPDVILMDLIMPGMGGIEATRAIRNRYSSVQIIALTSSRNRIWCSKCSRRAPSATS